MGDGVATDCGVNGAACKLDERRGKSEGPKAVLVPFREVTAINDCKWCSTLSLERLLTCPQVTAVICLPTFIQAYVQRESYHDLAYWLLFLLFFIFNTVGCVMNAYNNITWESDRLHYEEGEPPMKHTKLAILGIPS